MTDSAILHRTFARHPHVDVPPPQPVVLSPSLETRNSLAAPARELKFLLTEAQARLVESDLRQFLIPDPHAQSGDNPGQYVTTTVYCDTPDFDVYFRRAAHARRKFRLRRYGFSEIVYLERKVKEGSRVLKRRTPISIVEIPHLNQQENDTRWNGDWFRRRLRFRKLSPKLEVMYTRTAYMGSGSEGPLRLTFDRSIRARRIDHWHVAPFHGGLPLFSDHVVCEFKFQGSLPTLFKAVIESRQLCPGTASKYRLGLEAVGFVPTGEPAHV
ncbi:MAG: polyphosphate polymerase domain-containing protein [Planctomycetaceae bacterium]